LAASAVRCRAVVDARQAPSRAVIAGVVRAIGSSNLTVVDPLDALCDAQSCYAIIGNAPMYRDHGHQSVQGSEHVWRRIQPRDLRILSRQDSNHFSIQ
jgi:hypothetical protein